MSLFALYEESDQWALGSILASWEEVSVRQNILNTVFIGPDRPCPSSFQAGFESQGGFGGLDPLN